MRLARDCCVLRGDEAETSEQINRDVELWEGDAVLGAPKESKVSLSYGWHTDWRRNAGRQREVFGFVPILHDKDNKVSVCSRPNFPSTIKPPDNFNQRFIVSHSGISCFNALLSCFFFNNVKNIPIKAPLPVTCH